MTSKSLVLLSGERSSIPEAEAKALFLTYDPYSTFESPEDRVLIVTSKADPNLVASRIAFARRVGALLEEPSKGFGAAKGKRVRFRRFSLRGAVWGLDVSHFLRGLDASVDLANPELEFTMVEGRRTYFALTAPGRMRQNWSLRRPRRRPFFHPAAIFPKLSRALVNMTRCKEGELFLDPFAGTGSLPLEAAEIGARVVAADQSSTMVAGALSNMEKFRSQWLGVVRADAFHPPFRQVDAIATDIPYGRASSTRGSEPSAVLEQTLLSMRGLLARGRRMTLMHNAVAKVESGRDWTLEEEHHLYVHKRLTRAISILRRE